MVRKRKWQKHWQTPQIQPVTLGADFAWILRALDKQPEGRSGALRTLLHESLGSRGRDDLEIIDHSEQEGVVQVIPPTRMIAGYEHLASAVESTRAKLERRLKRPVERTDVIRSVLWNGLVERGVKAPKKPRDLYELVRARPTMSHAAVARELGVSWKIVLRVRKEIGFEPPAEHALMSRRLRGVEVEMALDADLSQNEAAELLDVSQKTIAKLRAREGYVTPPERAVHANRYSDEVKALAVQPNQSLSEAVRLTGMSAVLVGRLRREAGISSSRRGISEKQMTAALDTDLSYEESAKKSGLSQSTVRRLRQAAGLTTTRPSISDAQRKIALRRGLTISEAAKMAGISVASVSRIRQSEKK